MLGFPIRTSPDHSSFANSPGLIAGYYVLHRLLMPRHPPCALHSLSHKHSTKTTKIRQRQPQSQKRAAVNATRPYKSLAARCSRPLSNSQTTSPPTQTRPGHPDDPTKETRDQPQRLMPQDSTACHDPPTPTPATFHAPTPGRTHGQRQY